MAEIDGGALLWARQTVDSEIFFSKPDKWFKIWFYLVSKVKFEDAKKFKRGQCLMKYEWIQEKTGATKAQVDKFMRWSKKEQMLTTRKTTRGMIVTIINYDTFQSLANYKDDSLDDTETIRRRYGDDTILKNDNNDKKEKNKERSIKKEKVQRFKPPTSEQITDFLREQNLTINIDTFLDHYQSNGWMVGKNKMKDWKATVRNWARRDKEKKNKPELKARNFREEYNIQSAKAFLERGKDEF